MTFCDYYTPDRLGHFAMDYDESVLTRKWNRLKRLENILVKNGREDLVEDYPKGYSFGCGPFDSQVQKIYNFEAQLDQVISIYTKYVSSITKEEKGRKMSIEITPYVKELARNYRDCGCELCARKLAEHITQKVQEAINYREEA